MNKNEKFRIKCEFGLVFVFNLISETRVFFTPCFEISIRFYQYKKKKFIRIKFCRDNYYTIFQMINR